MSQEKLPRQPLLMLLIGLDPEGLSSKGINGITRLQKLLFLLWKEAGIREVETGFEFQAYKKGPYSRKLYDELELLENLGLIQAEVEGEATSAEAAELEQLSFEDLMGDEGQTFDDPEAATADVYEERRFRLTKRGKSKVQALLKDSQYAPFVDGIRKIKTKFADYSLQDLLYHVYTKYDDEGWTNESDIRDQVLQKGRRR